MSHVAGQEDASQAPSVAILGADALLAVRPATPIQAVHACLALGFLAVFPASWGDELVAAACLGQLEARDAGPVLLCSCPLVAGEMESAPELAPAVVTLVAPPVAAARYLRALQRTPLRITYIGACPAAEPPDIDARLTPVELLAELAARGIEPLGQPDAFDSVVPPDRRRHWSLPGGAPSPEALRDAGHGRTLVEAGGENDLVSLAQHLISREPVVLDPAPGFGCMCSGAVAGRARSDARAAVMALEPPRAATPVVDTQVVMSLARPFPNAPTPAAASESEVPESEVPATGASPTAVAGSGGIEACGESRAAETGGTDAAQSGATASSDESLAGEAPPRSRDRRRFQTPVPARRAAAPAPVLRTEHGRVLPRAYAAQRLTPGRGMTAVSENGEMAPPDEALPADSISLAGEPALEDSATAFSATEARGGDGDTGPRSTRSSRAVVVPLPDDRPQPVPPPQSGRSRALLVLGGAVALMAAALLVRMLVSTPTGRAQRAVPARDSTRAPTTGGAVVPAVSITPASGALASQLDSAVPSAADSIRPSGPGDSAVAPGSPVGSLADSLPGPRPASAPERRPPGALAHAAHRTRRSGTTPGAASNPARADAPAARESLERRRALFDSVAQLADSLSTPPERR